MINNILSVCRKAISLSLVLILAFLLGSINSNAQIISYPAPAQSITRGLDSTLLTIRIDFPACVNPQVTIHLGSTNNAPGIIEYIPGSITKTGGTPSLTITESNISNLRKPVFSISSPNVGEFVIFTIKRKANCGEAAASKDSVVVSGGCNFSESDLNVNTYNLFAPALTLVPPGAIANVTLGVAYNRAITITNGGNGCLDTLGFWIKYVPGEIQLNSLMAGLTTLTPVFQNPDSTYFALSGTILGSDKLFCNGESITLTENFTPLKCNTFTNYGIAWYSHSGAICESNLGTGNITMNNNIPVLSASLPNTDKYDYCFTGETKIQTVRIVNTGAGPAGNIALKLSNVIPGSFTGRNYFDTSTAWLVKDKTGSLLGVVNRFSENRTYGASDASCTSINGINETKGLFSDNIILAAGDTIYVEVVTKGINLSCSQEQCKYNGMGHVGIQSQLNYKNQCGSGNYSESFKTIAARNYTEFIYTLQNQHDIDGFAPANQFNLTVSLSIFRNVNSPSGSGTTIFAVPLAGTGLSPTTSSVVFAGFTLPVTVINDTMFVGPFPQNTTNSPGDIIIPMEANCSAGDGSKTINSFFLNQYSVCSPVLKMACRNSNIVIHCPTPCPKGGATPLSFSLKRINYGLPDNDNNREPDASGSVNISLISDHNSVNGDTLQGLWKVKIHPNTDATDPNFGGNIPYVYIDFELGTNGIGAPATLNALPNATAEVWRSNVNIATLTRSATILGTKAHYEFNSAGLPGGYWLPGDSILIRANYTVNQYNTDRFGGANYMGFDVFVTNNEVYSAYTQKINPQTAPLLGETYTCDHYNDYNQMSRIWISPYIPSNQIINGCNNLQSASIRYYTRAQEGGGIFPYEYRNFYIPDTMRIQIPPGFTYRPNSAYFYDLFNIINNSDVYQVGDTLIFTNLKKFYTPFGGSYVPGDESDSKNLQFGLQPVCGAITGIYNSYTNTTGMGNAVNTPGNNYKYYNGYPSNAVFIYNAPQPTLSGGGKITSTDGTAQWNLVLQNISNIANAENCYFYISPVNGVTNIVVREGASIITPDGNGFYQLGTLLPSANRLFTISGEASGCNADSIQINQGWSCSGYPSSFSSANCTNTRWLSLDAHPSQIQLSVTKQPTTTGLPLCSSETVEFVINSAQAAFADNPQFWAIPPTGLNISSGEIEYPLGSGNWQTITPIPFAGTLIYNVEEHLQLQALYGTKGLPGTIDYPGTDRRQAKLRLTFTTDCSFTSGAKMVVQQKADRPCGVGIPFNLGYNSIVRTDPIFVDGAMGVGSMSFNVALSPASVSCGTVGVAGNVTPVGANTSVTDTVVVTLPAGISYVGNFIGAPNATFISNTPGPAGSSIIKIKIAPGIVPGTTIPYNFDVVPDFNSGCVTLAITSESERSFVPLVCGATLCSNPPKVIMGSTLNNIVIQRPDIVMDNISIVSGAFAPGNTINVNVAVTNNSTVTAPANSFEVEFFCGASVAPFAIQSFPNTVPGNGVASASFTINIPNTPICSDGETLMGVIRPSATSCVCGYTNLLVAGGLALPGKFVKFVAKKVNNSSVLNFAVAQISGGTVFTIERSINGEDFYAIGNIRATSATEYNFTDAFVIKNTANYYRIKEANANGKTTYSETRILKYNEDGKIIVYPVPVIQTLNIALPDELLNQTVLIKLFNSRGQEVLHKNIDKAGNTVLLDIGNLPGGIYQIRVVPKSQAYAEKSAAILKQ